MNKPLTVSRHDALIDYWPDFLARPEQQALFERLAARLAWTEETLRIAGRDVAVPRRVAWYGDPQARYAYSGVMHEPLPWTRELTELKAQVEQICQARFNSVLANHYRHGRDSMGWHADNEAALGREPVIASLSLGAKRRFLLQHHDGSRLELALGEGSLLLMAGATQHHWRHCLPKTAKPVGPRINLTFRFVH